MNLQHKSAIPAKPLGKLLLLGLAAMLCSAAARGQSGAIDTAHSKLTVRVFKSGLFSNLVHDHEIDAPIREGRVNAPGNPSVELRVDARRLRVLDPTASEKDRAAVQAKMLSADVPDSEQFPDIAFKSTSATAKDADHWTVRGELTLHGKTRPIMLEVTRQAGHYTGQATVRQTDFGIKPPKVGTVKMKDDVAVEFDIQTAP